MAFKYKFKSALWKTEIQSYVQLVSDTLSIADVYCLSYCQAEEQRFIEQIFLSNLEKRRFITQRNIFFIVIYYNLLGTCPFLFALSSETQMFKSRIKRIKRKNAHI